MPSDQSNPAGRADPLPRLRLNEAGALIGSFPDGRQTALTVRACFPWSDPERYLSLRDGDQAERALISDLKDLDPASREALRRALAGARFTFDITAIHGIEKDYELRVWRVATNRGDRNFQTLIDTFPYELPRGGLAIRDLAGDLYVIRDPAALDAASRHLLWAYGA